ncbi:MAG: helix-turn-helix domain-containing protein [Chloroflexota bacterium]|nr:helix-turn-helix domain-containing protein [Chloroflexota bacterium]
MNKAVPPIHESVEELKHLLSRERQLDKQQRLHALYLLASGQARSRSTVATLLGFSRATVGRWLSTYAQGGLPALLNIYIPTGRAPALAPAQLVQLQAALDRPEGFASYGAVQQWIANNLGVAMGYHAVYKLVRRKLRAKLKVPRPQHEKKRAGRGAVSSRVSCAGPSVRTS